MTFCSGLVLDSGRKHFFIALPLKGAILVEEFGVERVGDYTFEDSFDHGHVAHDLYDLLEVVLEQSLCQCPDASFFAVRCHGLQLFKLPASNAWEANC